MGPRERQLRPDGQFAVFIFSGKQMTERKPLAGMGNAARAAPGTDLGHGGRKTPFQSAGPASAQDAQATRVPGCGGGGCAPQGSQVAPPGLRRALHMPTANDMQMYVNSHANREHLFASAARALSWVVAAAVRARALASPRAGGAEARGAGAGVGSGRFASAGEERGAAPSPCTRAAQARAGVGDGSP